MSPTDPKKTDPNEITNLPLIKKGSVKNLRGPLQNGEIVFEFTNDFSVFDWGKMPDVIPEKGKALLGVATHLFQELTHPLSWKAFFRDQKSSIALAKIENRFGQNLPVLCRELESIGMRSCFRGLFPVDSSLKDATGLRVEALQILPPKAVESKTGTVFDYSDVEINPKNALIPLEVVFRHGLTENSSFFERNPETTLQPGHRFELPLIEFFTKLEPTDRFIATREDACKVGRISEDYLLELELRAILLSLWLERECRLRELDLVDGKFEWGFDGDGRILLADAIGPDELRLLELRGTTGKPDRLSKEFLREYYRDSDWFKEIGELKKEHLEPNWQKSVKKEVPRLPAEGIQKATALYRKLERRFRPETVLLFGSGGREHALARKLLESPNIRTLYWAPAQDAGMAQLEAMLKTGAFPYSDRKRIVRWSDDAWSSMKADALVQKARESEVTLVIFSQDSDLASGAADHFRDAGFSVFGPSMAASRIEWSKNFSKELCLAAGVPTARSFSIRGAENTRKKLSELPWTETERWVVKADGLALGKGVVVAETREDALASIDGLLMHGETFLIEEFLNGTECSWFALADGETFSLLDPAKDYKRLRDHQKGPNTGGMGAVSPAPGTTPELRERIRSEIFAPIFAELQARGIRYQGLLYAGMMIFEDRLSVLEFNARFGDPETQALLPRMQGDLLEWIGAVAEKNLLDYPRDMPFTNDVSVYVVAAAEGYPERPRIGAVTPLDEKLVAQDHYRFAGLTENAGKWLVSGGRVLGALGRGSDVDLARQDAYTKLELTLFPGAQIRKDIGK